MAEANPHIFSEVSYEEKRVLKELEEFLSVDVLVYESDVLKEHLDHAKKLEGKMELLIDALSMEDGKRQWEARYDSLEKKIQEIESGYYKEN